MALARGILSLWEAERERLDALQGAQIRVLTTEASKIPGMLRSVVDDHDHPTPQQRRQTAVALTTEGFRICGMLQAHLVDEVRRFSETLHRFAVTTDVLRGTSLTTGLAGFTSGCRASPEGTARLFASLGLDAVSAAALSMAPPLAISKLRAPSRVLPDHVHLEFLPLLLVIDARLGDLRRVA